MGRVIDAGGAREFLRRRGRWPDLGPFLIHPCKRELAAFPREFDRRRPHPESKHKSLATGGDHALVDQRKGASDRRVTCHRKLAAGREDPHADIGIGPLRGKNECAFREVHLAREGLHGARVDAARVGEHGQLIAFEASARENVVLQEAKVRHPHRMPLSCGAWPAHFSSA